MRYVMADFRILADEALLQTARDLVADAAGRAGFESFEETAGGLKGYAQYELADREALDGELADLGLPGVEVSYVLSDVEDKDWNEEWEKGGFDPIIVDGKIGVYDARTPLADVNAPLPILIQARQAFGTGTHPTTRMVLSTLLYIGADGRNVLDCGCGTGVLGIAASKLGAARVVAYDIDEWSVDNTRHNAALNSAGHLEVYHGDVNCLSHVSGMFDIVMANIHRNIILADMPQWKEVMSADGTMILSGFYEQDVPLLLQKAAALGLEEAMRKTEDGWCCLTLRIKA